jgi:4-hydroxyphenylacetate 3-monooxygenase
LPIKNGEQYVRSIDLSQPCVIYRGERIAGKLSEHEAFRGLLATQAAMYDMQGQEPYRDRMTYESPHSGERVGLSFLMPQTVDDLQRRRTMMSMWADLHHGFLGRSPDYMNTALMAYASAADIAGQIDPAYADNLKNYYIYCRERDITLSHAFVQPLGCRSSVLFDDFEHTIAAKVEERNAEGMIVSGAFLLATQAATSDEILIYPAPIATLEGEDPYSFAFAIPVNTRGVTLVCRESYVKGDSEHDYPLSARFDEMDALVLCDRVQVPGDRIFLYGNAAVARALTTESCFHAHVSHQTLCRYIAKTEFFLGTAERLARLAEGHTDGFKSAISEMIVALEVLKSLLVKAEVQAKPNRWGVMVPDRDAMLVANAYYPKIYPRLGEIIRQLASSRLVMLPFERDFRSDAATGLQKYLQISDTEARQVVALNRLAWELGASSFAGRQEQYERYFFGAPDAIRERLYDGYSGRQAAADRVNRLLSRPRTRS